MENIASITFQVILVLSFITSMLVTFLSDVPKIESKIETLVYLFYVSVFYVFSYLYPVVWLVNFTYYSMLFLGTSGIIINIVNAGSKSGIITLLNTLYTIVFITSILIIIF